MYAIVLQDFNGKGSPGIGPSNFIQLWLGLVRKHCKFHDCSN
jgi:hypothetical protein